MMQVYNCSVPSDVYLITSNGNSFVVKRLLDVSKEVSDPLKGLSLLFGVKTVILHSCSLQNGDD